MLQLLIYLKWILFILPVGGWLIFQSDLSREEFFILALIGAMAGWGVSLFSDRLVYPPGQKGTRIRFKRCLKRYRMDEAQKRALETEDPYRTRMLRLAWYRFSKKKYAPGYRKELFCWLDKLTPEQRERVVRGAYRRYGIALIKISIRNLYDWQTLRSDVDWPIVDKIGYVLSYWELKRASKYGDKRAIEMLRRSAGKEKDDAKK